MILFSSTYLTHTYETVFYEEKKHIAVKPKSS